MTEAFETAPSASQQLAEDLTRLAQGDAALRDRAEQVIVSPLNTVLDELRNYLQAQPVTLETLPSDIAREWVTQDGRFKVEILAKGDPNDNETLRKFALAVLAVEPDAIGGPVFIVDRRGQNVGSPCGPPPAGK